MMQDFEFIFAKKLRDKLIEKVHGGVKTWITEDTLHVSIRREEINVQWEMTVDNMTYRINHGLSVDDVVWSVMKQYRAFIMNEIVEREFFKTEREESHN